MAIDLGQTYQRAKEGFRFLFGGLKTNAQPDALPEDKYPIALNVRATRDGSIRTRWGVSFLFAAGAGPITAIRGYTTLLTDNLPRLLACVPGLSTMAVWLSGFGGGSVQVGTLANNLDGASGATLIPFRPAESSQPWMYVANGSDYQKFSAPLVGSDVVTAAAVGIAEPPDAPNAGCANPQFNAEGPTITSFTNGGTAGAISTGNRVSDTVQSLFLDPSGANGYPTIGVTSSVVYARQMHLTINANASIVQDVFPGTTLAISIAAIYYFVGASGRCVVVPRNIGSGPGVNGQSIYTQNLLNSLRRGALVKFSGSAEVAYVWSVTEGPDGSVCFETSTTVTHIAGETITFPPAVQVLQTTGGIAVGQTILSGQGSFAITTGIGTATTSGLSGVFLWGNFSPQPDDYIQFSINVSAMANFAEAKLMFDVGDGSFTQNFYYYTVRASDVTAAIQNTLTQLGAAQLVSQRAAIDAESAAASHNQLSTSSSAQTTPGDGQWAEVIFPISALTRVGNDQTKTLQNTNAIQLLVNATGSATIKFGTITIFGGYSPDVGSNGSPYLYRVRPRASSTGVKGNPSPETRYGVNPRRAQVTIIPPSSAYDPQIDTWDIFRYGGTVTSWRKIGQCSSTAPSFIDNYGDDAATEGEALEFDNLQPWPTVVPAATLAISSVVGFTAVMGVQLLTSQLLGIPLWLPGNLVQIGGINVYTLRKRPTLLAQTLTLQTWLLEFVENAGSSGVTTGTIQEPLTAQSRLAYMWGPDTNGTIFAVGDPFRPGTFSTTKPYAPDAAPDAYNQELTAPSEPLMGGEVLDGLSFVASPLRWWALYPQLDNPAQRYNAMQQPIARGLAAPYGHCTDGREIFFWASDGIWGTSSGSLTEDDLSNLFPRDGVPGLDVTYHGITVHAPDYSRSITFRLAYANHYIYATYQDKSGAPRTLVYDQNRKAWSVDDLNNADDATVYYAIEQPDSTLLSSGTMYAQTIIGSLTGRVYTETDHHNDDSTPITSTIATREWDGGDVRSGEQWGDLWLDLTPASATGVTVVPLQFGLAIASSQTVPQSAARVQTPVSLGGGVLSDFLGIQVSWVDDFLAQSDPTVINIWQPSFLPKPESTIDRITDWYDGGTEKAKYVQGFLLHADTGGFPKGIAVRDSDNMQLHPFTPSVVHGQESILAYSFVTPFIAHTMRLEPTDLVSWRFFDVEFIFEATPESAETWQTQGTSFGLNGYSHIQRIVAAYASVSPVTLVITSFDGQSPVPITLPATGGAYQKALRVLTPNKGQLYTFAATSPTPFQLYLEDFEILVGGWGRESSYLTYKSLGGNRGDQARV